VVGIFESTLGTFGLNVPLQFAPIAAAAAKLKARSIILDGEAFVLDAEGKADFGALRGELDGRSTRLFVHRMIAQAPADAKACTADGIR
jgi:ATP-dependent DNA ligase